MVMNIDINKSFIGGMISGIILATIAAGFGYLVYLR